MRNIKNKRITMKDEEYGNYVQNIGSELNKPKIAVSYNGKIHGTIIDRLAELEDKIENGTLVEIAILDKDIFEDCAHKIFDSWNDITGAINKNCSWYYETLSVIDEIVGMVWDITTRQAEAKLRELNKKPNFTNHTSEPDWN